MNELWVPAWLSQFGMLIMGVFALLVGRYEAALIVLTGSLIIGAMRQIERERRNDAAK